MKPQIIKNEKYIEIIGHYDNEVLCAKLTLLADLYAIEHRSGYAKFNIEDEDKLDFIDEKLEFISALQIYGLNIGTPCYFWKNVDTTPTLDCETDIGNLSTSEIAYAAGSMPNSVVCGLSSSNTTYTPITNYKISNLTIEGSGGVSVTKLTDTTMTITCWGFPYLTITMEAAASAPKYLKVNNKIVKLLNSSTVGKFIAGSVSEDIVVPRTGTSYTITPTLSNVTASSSNPSTITEGGTATLTYTAASGYSLPSSVSVTGATGSWNSSTGVLTLSNPTGNVSFSISGVAAAHTITYNLTNVTGASSNPATVQDGAPLEAYFAANSGYTLPQTITVTGASASGWSSANGYFFASNIKQNVNITITGQSSGVTYNLASTPLYTYAVACTEPIGVPLSTLIGMGFDITMPFYMYKEEEYYDLLSFTELVAVNSGPDSGLPCLVGVDTEGNDIELYNETDGWLYPAQLLMSYENYQRYFSQYESLFGTMGTVISDGETTFTSNNTSFTGLRVFGPYIIYGSTRVYNEGESGWQSSAYQTVTFSTDPVSTPSELSTWLQYNIVK